jgi:DNA invertase Pin-like site-specific DNA recombinase
MSRALAFGYVLAAIDPRAEGVEAQSEAIEGYCRRAGLSLHGVYCDVASAGRLPLSDREAGSKLQQHLQPGDHVIVANLDCMVSTGIRCGAVALDGWCRRGVSVHVLRPACYLDASSPDVRKLAGMFVELAEAANRAVGALRMEAKQRAVAEGRRYSRFAPYGYRHVKRDGKYFLVPEPSEIAIRDRVLELDAEGWSTDRIRQHMAYEWRVRNRKGNEFGYTEVYRMIRRGLAEKEAEAATAAESSPA